MRCSDPSTVIQEGCRPDEKMREKWEYIEYIAKPLKKKKKKVDQTYLQPLNI